MSLKELIDHLRAISDKKIAEHSQRFFKTAKGEYGYGDRFMGIRVPKLRRLVRSCRSLSYTDILLLLRSDWHEQRLLALLILVDRFDKADAEEQMQIVSLYHDNVDFINNWDLVDCSAHKILGPWYFGRDRSELFVMARSDHLWKKRIAIMTSLYFIKNNDFGDTLKLAEILLTDPHDLIQKAVGWMLREVGNRNRHIETSFLEGHYRNMPRTMLRYAIEKYPESERQDFLQGNV